jgi:biotin-dependent carboxylase-like uncharacterized protein
LKPGLRILQPGVAATLQDGGRLGYQRFGVPVSGALDAISSRIANIIAGNPPDCACVEILGAGLTVKVEEDSVLIAVAGAAQRLALDDGKAVIQIAPFQGVMAKRGDIVRFGPPTDGAVYYVAVAGGFDVPPVLGSRSTYRRAGIGGLEGRALQAGDLLPLAIEAAGDRRRFALDVELKAPRDLRVMRGPNAGHFSEDAFKRLFSSPYTISAASDRMGLRLQGPAVNPAITAEMPSQGTTAGGMQVAADGQPILLLADRQTTGGYPRIATVIGADIAAAGRLAAGMTVRFQEVGREEALHALQAQRDWLASLPGQLRPLPDSQLSAEHLLSHNLIGGVTAGPLEETA